MTKVEMTQTLVKELEDLSTNTLQEILDFVEFMKIKEWRARTPSLSSQHSIYNELQTLEMSSLIHLEEEFADYKEQYLYEERCHD